MAHQFNPRDYSHHRGHGRGGRGRGRGRGGRGRYFDRNEDEDNDSRRGRGRGRHPSGLKGKDIGLWYARQSKKKTKHDEIKQVILVTVETIAVTYRMYAVNAIHFDSKTNNCAFCREHS